MCCEESGHQRQPQSRPSAHGSQQKALPSRITAFAGSTLHWQLVLHWHLMRSVVMVNTGMEHFCSMPRESFPKGGRPTLEVRFNVRLCVAETVRSLSSGSLLKQALRVSAFCRKAPSGADLNAPAEGRRKLETHHIRPALVDSSGYLKPALDVMVRR